MARISTTIDIDATPQEVWDVATDLKRMGELVSIHQDFPDAPPSDLSEGSHFKQTLKIAGTPFLVDWTATEVDSPEKVSWDGSGPAGSTAHTSYAFSATDGGTRLTYENEFNLPAGKVGEAAAGVVSGQAEQQADDSLKTLKELIEA